MLICGQGISVTTADLYDPAAGTFAATGKMTTSRDGHSATLLADGRVLIAGGVGTTYLASAEVYDPATKSFSTTGSLTSPRAYHTATLLPDGKVLIAGGIASNTSAQGPQYVANAELYDPQTGSFATTGKLTVVRSQHTVTPLSSGQILLIGGSSVGGRVSSAELYYPATETFAVTGSLSTERSLHTASRLTNGQVLVAGGYNFTSVILARTELYR